MIFAQPRVKWVSSLLPGGKAAGAWPWPLITLQHQGSSMGRAIPLPPTCAYLRYEWDSF